MDEATLNAGSATWRAALVEGPTRWAYVMTGVIAGALGLAILWASQAKLEEATRGEGRVVPSSKLQVIQHLEGGIISEILVRDGDVVTKDQVLMRLKDTMASTEYRDRTNQYLSLRAKAARLTAEFEGLSEPKFDLDVSASAPDVVRRERELFDVRQSERVARIEALEGQIRQREADYEELQSRARHLGESLRLARQELAMTEPLIYEGVVSQVEVLRLRRQVNDLQGELASVRLSLKNSQAAIEEAREHRAEQESQFRARSLEELNEAKVEISRLKEGLNRTSDELNRTEVRSPVDGIVKQVMLTTEGGVVRPGADLFEIVPLEDSLLVEARVDPSDIAFLHPGQPAKVKITAYDFAVYGSLDGSIDQIGADAIEDQQERRTYYRVYVRTDGSHLMKGGEELPILPGMVAQVDILTGEKSVLDYLLKPIVRARQAALRER